MYKIIYDGQVIDVVRNPSFLRFLSSGHIAITDKSSAQGIVGSDTTTIYSFTPVSDTNILTVSIESITSKEFNRLQSLLNSEQKISVAQRELLKAKEAKIKVLSDFCKVKIIDGFTVSLSDHKNYHFKLTAEDQLNLLNLENQLNAGVETFIYHATGLPCQIFMRDDMRKIINAFRKHVLYHTTYFNSAKQYINSLDSLNDIENFAYGMNITGAVTDPTIRQILIAGGIN
jgi:hypothetical protein